MAEAVAQGATPGAQAGARLVLVTGRPPRGMAEISEALGRRIGTAICSNGALTYDRCTGEVTPVELIAPEQLSPRRCATCGPPSGNRDSPSSTLAGGPSIASSSPLCSTSITPARGTTTRRQPCTGPPPKLLA